MKPVPDKFIDAHLNILEDEDGNPTVFRFTVTAPIADLGQVFSDFGQEEFIANLVDGTNAAIVSHDMGNDHTMRVFEMKWDDDQT